MYSPSMLNIHSFALISSNYFISLNSSTNILLYLLKSFKSPQKLSIQVKKKRRQKYFKNIEAMLFKV